MKDRIQVTSGVYCDTGPNLGSYRIDISGSVYLGSEEYSAYLLAIERNPRRRGMAVFLLDSESTHDESVHPPITSESERTSWKQARGVVPRPEGAPRAEDVIRAGREDEDDEDAPDPVWAEEDGVGQKFPEEEDLWRNRH